MTNFKIKRNIEGICIQCAHSRITEFNNGDIETICTEAGAMFDSIVKRPVKHCNRFRQDNTLDHYEMQKIAWVLNTDKSGKVLGFNPPSKKQIK